jgi:hypothetical protein
MNVRQGRLLDRLQEHEFYPVCWPSTCGLGPLAACCNCCGLSFDGTAVVTVKAFSYAGLNMQGCALSEYMLSGFYPSKNAQSTIFCITFVGTESAVHSIRLGMRVYKRSSKRLAR